MADFSEDLKAYIQGLATIAGDRVYYDRAPQNASLPFVVITQAQGGEYFERLEGAAGKVQTPWHIYSYDATRPGANTLSENIRKQLHRFGGLMGTTYVDNVSLLAGPQTDVDNSIDGSYTPRYWVLLAYDVFHSVAEIT